MAKILTPASDLLFMANNQVKIGNGNGKGHLHSMSKTKEVADDERFEGEGLHVHGRSDKIAEKLDVMAQTILDEDWIRFDTFHYDVSQLNPSHKCLNDFGREQMRDAVVRNSTILQLETLRRKLAGIGVAEEAMDEGYEEAQKDPIYRARHIKTVGARVAK